MKTNHGFTLIELIVTVAAAIVILAVGIPVFSTMIANNRAAADSNALVTAFQFARSEAVKRSAQVRVCAGDGDDSNPTPAGCGGDWTGGLLVQVASSGEILRVWDRFEGNVTITEDAGRTQVVFASDGAWLDDGGGAPCLDIQRALAVGAQARRWLGLYTTGRTQVSSTQAEVQPCSL